MNAKTLSLLLLVVGAGCYIEPAGRAFPGKQVSASSGVLPRGIEFSADGPVLVGALEANIEDALATLVGLGATEDEVNGITSGLVITVDTTEDCLIPLADEGSCTYARSTWSGTASDWSPAGIRLNRRGTQLAHEFLHLLKAWRNVGGNSDHSSWTADQWQAVDGAANRAYRITR